MCIKYIYIYIKKKFTIVLGLESRVVTQAVPPDEDVFLVKEGKLDRWTMYFDGAVNICGNKADAMIISPNKK
jgi:hypothetical protein